MNALRTVKADLPSELDTLKLYTFSDWHIGDRFCDYDAIKREIQTVADTENAYVICNGDLMNNATKTSVSDSYAEEIPPMEQIDTVFSLLNPIKDKILCMTQGNHEARTYRNDGIDLTAIVAQRLGIYDRYVREGGVVFLRFGELSKTATGKQGQKRKVCYTIYVTHGAGGGRKEGAKAIRLADMASIVDCDVYIHSHTHLPMIMKQSFYRIDKYNSCVAQVEKLFVNTSAKLGWGGYGQTYEFKPTSAENPVVYFEGSKKAFSARL